MISDDRKALLARRFTRGDQSAVDEFVLDGEVVCVTYDTRGNIVSAVDEAGIIWIASNRRRRTK